MSREFSTVRFVPTGRAAILAAALVWALGYMARKTVLHDIAPLPLSFVNAAIVAFFFVASFPASARKSVSSFRAFPMRYVALAITGVALGSSFMFAGLDRLDLGIAVLLEKLQPLFTVPLAFVFLGEKTPRSVVPHIVLALLFAYVVSVPNIGLEHIGPIDPLGVLYISLAALTWAIAGVVGRGLMAHAPNALVVTILRFAIAAIILAPIAIPYLVLNGGRISLLDWITISAAAIVSTGGGYLLYYEGLRTVPATIASLLELVSPVAAVILGYTFLNERLTAIQIVAGSGLLLSIHKIATTKATS